MHKTRPPRRRTSIGRGSGDRKDRAAWSTTFFAGLLQSRLLAHLGEQASDDFIGQVLEGVMNFDFDLSKTRRILLQLLGPVFAQTAQLLVHLVQDRGERGNGRIGLGIGADLHGLSSWTKQSRTSYHQPTRKKAFALPYSGIAPPVRGGAPARVTTPAPAHGR